ncbi:MAG: LLM class flavin-dependent oxidoreductase [Candidatus Thorarchaeota archaeon]
MRWELGVNVAQSVTETIQTSINAAKGGVDQLWVIDFPSPYHAFGLAANIATEIKTRIGLGLVSPLLYRPTQIAQAVETLVESFGDRFDLLVGVGDRSQLRNIGIEYGEIGTLVSRMINSVREIKSILKEKSIETPILLAAQGPKMIKASIETDGIVLNFTDPIMIEWALQSLGKRPSNFRVGVFPPTSIVSSSDVSPSDDFRFSAAIVALGLSRKVSKKFNLDSILNPLKLLAKEKGKVTINIVDQLENHILLKFGLHTTPSEVAEYSQKVKELGVDHIIFGPPVNQMKGGISALIKAKMMS